MSSDGLAVPSGAGLAAFYAAALGLAAGGAALGAKKSATGAALGSVGGLVTGGALFLGLWWAYNQPRPPK